MNRMVRTRSFTFQDKEYQVQAEVLVCGEDLCVVFGGGGQPHIGAVALATPTESANNPGKQTITPSVIARPGHKEYQLALEAAELLSRALERSVAVTVGIHIDGITPELINKIVEEFHNLVADLAEVIHDKLFNL